MDPETVNVLTGAGSATLIAFLWWNQSNNWFKILGQVLEAQMKLNTAIIELAEEREKRGDRLRN